MAKKTAKTIDTIALVLMIIGALNWGFVLFKFNVVEKIFATIPLLVTAIYALVGVAAVWVIGRKLTGNK